MNDIGNVSRFLYSILYAGDTCVLLNGNDYAKLVKFLNSQLDKLSVWLKANQLSLNDQKTYYMCSILTKGSKCRKNKKLRFFLILIEQVMTNLFKKNQRSSTNIYEVMVDLRIT